MTSIWGHGVSFYSISLHWAAEILTPKSFLFMILMATFSPVRMWRPSLTLAKPPWSEQEEGGGGEAKVLTHTHNLQHSWSTSVKFPNVNSVNYPNRWSHKPRSICRARRLHEAPSVPPASFQKKQDLCPIQQEKHGKKENRQACPWATHTVGDKIASKS